MIFVNLALFAFKKYLSKRLNIVRHKQEPYGIRQWTITFSSKHYFLSLDQSFRLKSLYTTSLN